MKKQSKGSRVLTGAGALCFAAGGLSFLALKSAAIAAGLTAAGGALLILNAVAHPESINVPDVKIPEIKVPNIHVEY